MTHRASALHDGRTIPDAEGVLLPHLSAVGHRAIELLRPYIEFGVGRLPYRGDGRMDVTTDCGGTPLRRGFTVLEDWQSGSPHGVQETAT